MSVSLHLPPGPPAGPDSPHRRGRWVAAAAAAVVAVGAGVAAGFADGSDGSRSTGAGATPAPSATTPAPGVAGGPAPAGGARPAANPTEAPGSRPVPAPAQWLWPFTDATDAGTWQQAHRERGTQPWHLDPAATAIGFAGHLGYPGLDRALRSIVDGDEAYVAVGFRLPDGTPHRTDTVGIPAPGTLEIHYGSGRTERVPIEAQPGDDGRPIGLADADRDGRDEVFVPVGTGAYTDQTSVYRYADGRLKLVTLDGRGLVPVSGASVRTALSWACRPPDAPLVQWSGTSADGVTYPGTLVSYRFAGATVVRVSSRPLTADDHTWPPTGCDHLPTGSPR